MNKNYDDIINIEYFEPKNHKRMDFNKRAAQFAPFAALSGYSEAIKEKARLTDKKIEIDDALKQIINEKLIYLKDDLNNKISIKYFIKDTSKNGGKYINSICDIKKIDSYKKNIILDDNSKIDFNDIINLNIVK